MEWQFGYRNENIQDYVLIVAKLKLPVEVLYHMPLSNLPNDQNKFPVLVSVEKWEEMLSACLRTDDQDEQIAIATTSLRLLLKQLGKDVEDLTDPRVLQLQQIVDDSPDFIKLSDLELREKAYVADAYTDGVQDEIVIEANRLTIDRLTTRKRILESGNPEELVKFDLS